MYVSMLLAVLPSPQSDRRLFAMLNNGIVTITNYRTCETTILGATIYQAGGKRFAVQKNGEYICGSYDDNCIIRYDSKGCRDRLFAINRPQSMVALGDSYMVVNQNRDLFSIDRQSASLISSEPVVDIFALTDEIALLENEESLAILGLDTIIILEKYGKSVRSASLWKHLLAVGYLRDTVAIYDLKRAKMIGQLSLPIVSWQAQSLALHCGVKLMIFGQSFEPQEERWIAEAYLDSGQVNRLYSVPFDGGLGNFIDDSHFCQKNGMLYDMHGRVVRHFDFIAGSDTS